MSNTFYYLLLGIMIILNTAGGVMMKIGSSKMAITDGLKLMQLFKNLITNWPLIIGVFFYGITFTLASVVYSKINVSIAYPIMVGLTFLFVSIIMIIKFHESVNGIQIFGYVLLMSGVTLIASNLKHI